MLIEAMRRGGDNGSVVNEEKEGWQVKEVEVIVNGAWV